MKECNRCHEIKPKSEFHKRGNFQQYICKTCRKEDDHRRNLKNKDKKKIHVKEKICPTCKELKSSFQFCNNKYKPDGLSTQCKECEKKYRKNGSVIRTSEEWHKENLRKHNESRRRGAAKRRELGSEMLNEWQEGWDAHHIDKYHIIFMPYHLHKSIAHNVFTGKNMKEINELAFKYL